jgi:hypothetical protein
VWIYLPESTSSLSAPVLPASISASDWRFQALARSATWRETRMQSRRWCRLWKQKRWMRRLCGVMSNPSTADDGAARWIASLRATRASHSAQPGSASASRIPGISGHTLGGSSSSVSRGSSCSKTSRVTYAMDIERSARGWNRKVIGLRKDCLRRLKLARHISARGSSLLPTPTVQDASNNGGPSQLERNTPPLNAVVGGLLNPVFVEWLMGWPLGWTDCDSPVTGLSRWSQLMRWQLSCLASVRDGYSEPTPQMSMFEGVAS